MTLVLHFSSGPNRHFDVYRSDIKLDSTKVTLKLKKAKKQKKYFDSCFVLSFVG